MVWLIARHTVLKNLYDNRLVVMYALAVAVMALSGAISSREIERGIAHHSRLKELAEREANLDRVIVVRPPSPLLFVHSDIDHELPGHLIVSPDFVDYPVEDVSLKQLASPHQSLDWSFVLAYVFTVLALLLTFDAISGERERGTLKLIMSLGTSRSSYIFGSFLGAILTIIPIAALGYALNLLIVLSRSPIQLSGHNWAKIISAALISFLLIIAFAAIGLLTSTMSAKSSHSLLLALGSWAMFVVVIPISSVLIAEQISPTPSAAEIESEVEKARRLFFIQSYPISSEDLRQIYERQDLTEAEKRRKVAELQERIYSENLAALKRYHKRLTEIRESYLRLLLKQAESAHIIARISPFACYREAIAAITGTGLLGQKLFYQETKKYMQMYSQHAKPLRDKLRSQARIAGVTIRDKGYTISDIQEISYAGIEFDRSALPRFEYRETPISTVIALSLPSLGFLLFLAVLVLLLAYINFLRCQVL